MQLTTLSGIKHIYQSYVVLISDEINRDRLINKLKEKGIEANIGTYAMHMLDYDRKKYGFSENDFRNAKLAFEQSLALPLYPRMREDDVRFVARTILDIGRRE